MSWDAAAMQNRCGGGGRGRSGGGAPISVGSDYFHSPYKNILLCIHSALCKPSFSTLASGPKMGLHSKCLKTTKCLFHVQYLREEDLLGLGYNLYRLFILCPINCGKGKTVERAWQNALGVGGAGLRKMVFGWISTSKVSMIYKLTSIASFEENNFVSILHKC
jgi:hypothetical protein